MVSASLSSRIDRLFPSSRSLPILYTLPIAHELPSGERCSCICLTALSQVAGLGIERGVSILFSTGKSADSLCSLRIQVHFLPDGEVEMVHEITKHTGLAGNWRMDTVCYHANPAKTEPWKFESAEARVAGILDIVEALKPELLRHSHPLLNSLGIRKALLGNSGNELS